MTDLIDTREMYLKTVYELVEEGIVPMRARIGERLDHSGPTVSQTVARLERDGLVTLSTERHVELTGLGLALATKVMRKHRLAERLLVDVIGLDLVLAHEEACRWEHVISATVERRLLKLLDSPVVSPYGLPIPGLSELGAGPLGAAFSVLPASEFDGEQAVLAGIGELVQTDTGLLADLVAAGLVPGEVVHVTSDGDEIVLTAEDGRPGVRLTAATARHLYLQRAHAHRSGIDNGPAAGGLATQPK